jgi:hypothetical protein
LCKGGKSCITVGFVSLPGVFRQSMITDGARFAAAVIMDAGKRVRA